MHFVRWNVWISIKFSQKFVPKCTINNISTLVRIMAWRRPGDKPLSEPMMTHFTEAYMRHLASLSWYVKSQRAKTRIGVIRHRCYTTESLQCLIIVDPSDFFVYVMWRRRLVALPFQIMWNVGLRVLYLTCHLLTASHGTLTSEVHEISYWNWNQSDYVNLRYTVYTDHEDNTSTVVLGPSSTTWIPARAFPFYTTVTKWIFPRRHFVMH